MAHAQLPFIALAVSMTVLLGSSAFAQRGQGRQGGRIYNPNTEATITGTVDAVEHVTPPRGGGRSPGGVHVTLKTGTESIEVHLGPAAYLKSKHFDIEKGDTLKIVGSRVTLDGQPALIARTVTMGDQTVTLRDESGRPMWAGNGARTR